MPELPEVQTVCTQLSQILPIDAQIEKIKFLRKDLRFPIPIQKLQQLKSAHVEKIYRVAKYILWQTSKGTMISHLGMTGSWRVFNSVQKHDHVYIYFNKGLVLAYCDPRRFGFLHYSENHSILQHPLLSHLGPDPLSDSFDARYLQNIWKQKRTAVKVALMDQKCVVGVGNIYANEALFLAGIHPYKSAAEVSLSQLTRLVNVLRQLLHKAIAAGGSTLRDYVDANGNSGGFQNSFLVYNREGEACRCQQQKIVADFLGGRNTFWCPRCQK